MAINSRSLGNGIYNISKNELVFYMLYFYLNFRQIKTLKLLFTRGICLEDSTALLYLQGFTHRLDTAQKQLFIHSQPNCFMIYFPENLCIDL